MQESSCWAQAAGPAQVGAAGTAGTAASPTAPVQCNSDTLHNSLGPNTMEWSQLMAGSHSHILYSWHLGECGFINARHPGYVGIPCPAPGLHLSGCWQQSCRERGNGALVDGGTGESQLGALGFQENKQDQ